MAREEQNTSMCNSTKTDAAKKFVYWPSSVDVLQAERYDLSQILQGKQFRLIKIMCKSGKSFTFIACLNSCCFQIALVYFLLFMSK